MVGEELAVVSLLFAGFGSVASMLVKLVKDWVGRTKNQNITITIETPDGRKTIVTSPGTTSQQLHEMLVDALKPPAPTRSD